MSFSNTKHLAASRGGKTLCAYLLREPSHTSKHIFSRPTRTTVLTHSPAQSLGNLLSVIPKCHVTAEHRMS